MKIRVISFFYNEAALLPFFLSHYRWADVIHAVASRSMDGTVDILNAEKLKAETLKRGPTIEIEPFEFPDGFDDMRKRNKVNQILNTSPRPSPQRGEGEGWWDIVVDADELVWPSSLNAETLKSENLKAKAQAYLMSVPRGQNALTARMWSVFRHRTESDLDVTSEPIVLQRRHGDPDRSSPGNAPYQKPIVLRSNRGIQLGLGNHCLTAGGPASDTLFFDGAHWQNADPGFCAARRVRDRRDRLSAENRRLGLGAQHFHVNEITVRTLCAAHLNDPQCF